MEAIRNSLLDERHDLEMKLERLDTFLYHKDTLERVGEYHHSLLMAQRHAMNEYKKVLTMRIKVIEENM